MVPLPRDGTGEERSAAQLTLVPATNTQLRAALQGREALSRALGVSVPETWPHDFLDDAALVYTLERLEDGRAEPRWWFHFVVHTEERALVGSGGFKGAPDASGTVEIGYGIVADRRRRGYATAVARELTARAFEDPRVARVVAETLPELVGSIGVLQKNGFARVEGASEPGAIRFALERAAWERRKRSLRT